MKLQYKYKTNPKHNSFSNPHASSSHEYRCPSHLPNPTH